MSDQENRNPSESSGSSKPNGGGQPTTLSEHTYRVVSVPTGCEDYVIDDEVDLFVSSPPPQTVTLMPGGKCDGVVVTLVS